MLTTLPKDTPGLKRVKGYHKAIRIRRGFLSEPQMPSVVLDPNFKVGESPRFSRHAIKRLTEDYIRRNYK